MSRPADDHTTSPVSDAMVLKIMAERERDLGFTVYADWLDAGCPDKGADDQWEYPQEKIDDVRFYIVAMKAKEEAADPVDSEVKNIVSNWHSFKGQTADQPSADEIERQRRMSLLDDRLLSVVLIIGALIIGVIIGAKVFA